MTGTPTKRQVRQRRYTDGIERGERNLGYAALTRIARACEMPPSEPFDDVDDSRGIVCGLISVRTTRFGGRHSAMRRLGAF